MPLYVPLNETVAVLELVVATAAKPALYILESAVATSRFCWATTMGKLAVASSRACLELVMLAFAVVVALVKLSWAVATSALVAPVKTF